MIAETPQVSFQQSDLPNLDFEAESESLLRKSYSGEKMCNGFAPVRVERQVASQGCSRLGDGEELGQRQEQILKFYLRSEI